MKRFLLHLKKYVVRGLLAIIPLALSLFALKLLYTAVDQRAVRLVDQVFGIRFPGLGILFVIVVLYFLGLIASNVVGKQLFGFVESITKYFPIIRTTYKVGKQLVTTLSLPEQQVFKRVVLVQYLKPGIWTVGFVTGEVTDRANKDEILLKVFVPTPPNPASGTMVLVRQNETRDPGWSIEEGLNTVVSAGIIGPRELK
jgi:uncharacterized membrane protein